MVGRLRSAALGAVVTAAVGCTQPIDPTGVYDLVFDLTPADMRGQLTIPGGDAEGGFLLLRGMRTQRMGSTGMETRNDSVILYFAPERELRLALREDSAHGFYLVSTTDTVWVSGARSEEPPDRQVLAALAPSRQAPGLLSTAEQGDLMPAFGGGALVFTRSSPDWRRHVLLTATEEEGAWQEPRPLAFSGGPWNDRGAAFAPGDTLLVFSSDRPLPGDTAAGQWNLWRVGRTNGAWTEPEPLALNSDSADFHPSLTADGTLYFSSRRAGGHGGADIWRAASRGGAWDEPVNLGPTVNSALDEGSVLVDPAEAWLLVSVTERPGGLGGEDLWLAERTSGQWSELRNPGAPLNSFAPDYGAALEPGSGALWFSSHRRGLADLYRIPLAEAGIGGR